MILILKKIKNKLIHIILHALNKIVVGFEDNKKNIQDFFYFIRLNIEKFFYDFRNATVKKVKLSDNKALTDLEFAQVEKICDIFIAMSAAAEAKASPPEGGVFWSEAKKGNRPFDLHFRKNKAEIEHSFLFNTRFRDFPSIAYEMDELTPTPDFWIRRYIRLANATAKRWRVQIPARFGEIGWKVKGFPVNRLTAINQERVTALHLSGVTRYLEQQSAPKIMEIGAGSGEMGYVLCKALPQCTWYDCDLLGSLVYSAIHLAILLPQKSHYIYVGDLDLPDSLDESLIIRSAADAANLKNAVINIPNFLIEDFRGHLQLHMACNTFSFAEMPPTVVEQYADLLAVFLKDYGILFEQNGYLSKSNEESVETILLKKFKRQEWDWSLVEWDGKILTDGTRTWSNNSITNKLHSKLSEYEVYKIMDSLDNKRDVVDIEYPVNAWDKIAELFPNGV